MKGLMKIGILLVVMLVITSCNHFSRRDAGMVGGGVVGGVIGNELTGGSTLGTIGGAVGGGYLGRKLAD